MTNPSEPMRAPHVERKWAEAMLIELRLQGVAGERIAAALADVEAHCARTGEPAREAFGDPVDYARSLELPADARQEPAAIGRAVAPVLVQVIGSFAVLAAVPALRQGLPVALEAGHVVWLLAVLALGTGLVLAAESILRLLLQRPVVGMLGMAGILLVLVLPSILFPWTLAQVPAWLVLLVGLALLAGGAAWSTRRAGGATASGTIPVQTSGRGRLLGVLLVPAVTLVTALVLLLLS